MPSWRLPATITSSPRARRIVTRCRPTNPFPPVTTTRAIRPRPSHECERPQALEVGAHHHLDEILETCLRLPAKDASRLRRVADEMIDFRRAVKMRIDHDMVLPAEADDVKRQLTEVAYFVRTPGRDHEVVRRLLLQHQPHRAHVVAGETPIARRFEVAQMQFVE